MKIAFFLFIVVFIGTGGEIAATRAMKHVGEVKSFHPRSVLQALQRAFRLGWMWLALAMMTAAFFAFLALLSWKNVSFIVPLTALSYAVGAVGSKFLLKEQVAPLRWAGILCICAGVALVWAGGR